MNQKSTAGVAGKLVGPFRSCHLAILAVLALALCLFSCANQGVGPGGGPRDSIPPVVVRSIPEPFQINVRGNQIEVVFNEYVSVDKLNDIMVVSPPLAQRATVRTKGKGFLVKFNEDLIPDRTYSIDFKDGIKDYNEGNKLESLRMIFSTYDQLDTLRIKGRLLDAFTLNPVKNGVVVLYTIENDSIFRTLRPDFIAKTDAEGRFLFDNLPKTGYKLYALVDGDNNLMYTQPTESIAFTDSLIHVDATFIQKTDTLVVGTDTIVSLGYTQYTPDSVFCLMFEEKRFSQYMRTRKRTSREMMAMGFTESLCDSFSFHLTAYPDSIGWYYSEMSPKRDSVNIWLTDSLLAVNDTLQLSVKYLKTLKEGINSFCTDTVEFVYSKPKIKKPKKGEDEPDEKTRTEPFQISSNLGGGDFDLNKKVGIEMQWPIDTLPAEKIVLEKFTSDTVSVPQEFSIVLEPGSKRKYTIDFKLAEGTKYQLSIDSAAVHSLSGLPNASFSATFKTPKSDYYGAIILDVQGFGGNGIVCLLRSSDKEELVDTLHYKGQREVIFRYVKPEKFRIKLIDDRDGNGAWTTGNLDRRQSPERVYYFPKILKVRSNWESKEAWLIDPEKIEPKKLIDDEPEKK